MSRAIFGTHLDSKSFLVDLEFKSSGTSFYFAAWPQSDHPPRKPAAPLWLQPVAAQPWGLPEGRSPALGVRSGRCSGSFLRVQVGRRPHFPEEEAEDPRRHGLGPGHLAGAGQPSGLDPGCLSPRSVFLRATPPAPPLPPPFLLLLPSLLLSLLLLLPFDPSAFSSPPLPPPPPPLPSPPSRGRALDPPVLSHPPGGPPPRRPCATRWRCAPGLVSAGSGVAWPPPDRPRPSTDPFVPRLLLRVGTSDSADVQSFHRQLLSACCVPGSTGWAGPRETFATGGHSLREKM